jgi:hypothetical protein
VRIEPIDDSHIDGFRHAVDVVARERKYLASVEGFSREATSAFVRTILSGEGVSFVAVDEKLLVGWCDVVRPSYSSPDPDVRVKWRRTARALMSCWGSILAVTQTSPGGRLTRASSTDSMLRDSGSYSVRSDGIR